MKPDEMYWDDVFGWALYFGLACWFTAAGYRLAGGAMAFAALWTACFRWRASLAGPRPPAPAKRYRDRRPTTLLNDAARWLGVPVQVDPWHLWAITWRNRHQDADEFIFPMWCVFRRVEGSTWRRWGFRLWGLEVGDRGGFFDRCVWVRVARRARKAWRRLLWRLGGEEVT